jgi:DNA-binding HxlR family transcriptional regulator
MADYDLVAWIRRGKIKPQILKSLQEARTPTDLKKIIGVHRESISRALLEMQEKGLVVCLNPKQPNFRYYQTTPKGKKLLKKL